MASDKSDSMNYTELSTVISHALRHEPWRYDLELDEEGWASIKELLLALQKCKPAWKNLQKKIYLI
ncbi:RNA 2'-phosphotransferase [Baaleninema simplex]|uniref:RNA 2'-phosphotransferase n=1 Tax=Baaleninema simplex TaxID=2862350 RepID=UPI00192AD3CA|nr:RNA 2'-phosphotransferase [Baaleninema simplex]